MNDRINSGISPVYLLSKDLQVYPRVDNHELCIAISKVIGGGGGGSYGPKESMLSGASIHKHCKPAPLYWPMVL